MAGILSDRVPEKENTLLHQSCSPSLKGPVTACVQPISQSLRNLSDPLCSSKNTFGVSNGVSSPSAKTARGKNTAPGVCVYAISGGEEASALPYDDEEVAPGVSVHGAGSEG